MPFNKLAMKSELSMIKYSRLRGEVMVNDLRVLDDFLSLLAQCLFSSMMLVHFVVLACFVSVFELVFVLRCFV